MPNELHNTLARPQAKLEAPLMLLANHCVDASNAHSPYVMYGSLRFSAAPYASLNCVARYKAHLIFASSLHSIQVQQLQVCRNVLGRCGLMVGKLSKRYGKFEGFYTLFTSIIEKGLNRTLFVHKISTVYLHFKYNYSHVFTSLNYCFYTLFTKPTNTNKLIKEFSIL